MRQPLKTTIFIAFLLLATLGATWAEETPPPVDPTSLNGDWRVLLENSNSRKYIRFRVEVKDGRLRGKMASRDTGTQDLDGRVQDDGEILFWSTFTLREGPTIDTSFKGRMEGGIIIGSARYFNKPYSFRAERVEDDDKDDK